MKIAILFLVICCVRCYADTKNEIAGSYRDLDAKGKDGGTSIEIQEKGTYVAKALSLTINNDGSLNYSNSVTEEGTWELSDGLVRLEMKHVKINGKDAALGASPISHVLKKQEIDSKSFLVDPAKPEKVKYRKTA